MGSNCGKFYFIDFKCTGKTDLGHSDAACNGFNAWVVFIHHKCYYLGDDSCHYGRQLQYRWFWNSDLGFNCAFPLSFVDSKRNN